MDNTQEVLIKIGADTSGFKEGVQDVQNGLKNLGNTPVDKPIKTLKQELKEANNEAQRMERQFGKNSQEFTKAAKRVAELKDEFNEYRQSVDAFNPDNKLAAITSLAKGATGAIGGISGAMAFLGVEGEKASETMAKLQGLMAFSQALDSVDDIKNSFKNLGSVITSTSVYQTALNLANKTATTINGALGLSVDATSTSFKGMRAAIIGTGIGALIIGLIALVQNFDKVKVALGFASAEQEAYNAVVKEGNKAAQDSSAKAIQSVSEMRAAFALAEKGVISKKEALDKYNSTLGDAFGKTNDLKTAEKLLADKAEAYIKMTMLKAQANVMFTKAAEEAAKQLQVQNEDQTSWLDKAKAGLQNYLGDVSGGVNTMIKAQKEGEAEATKTSKSLEKSLNEQGTKLLQQVQDLSTESGVASEDAIERRKKDQADTIAHYDNLIKIAQANGKDTYSLERQKWQAKLKTAVEGSAEYEAIQADLTALEASHGRNLAEALKDERQKLKDHLAAMQKIVDEANKAARDSKLDERSKELNDSEVAYEEQKKATQKQTDDFIKDIKERLKKHLISEEEANNSITQAKKKQSDVEAALLNEKSAKDLETEKKYNKVLKDFRSQYEETEYQRSRAKLIEDFDEKIKLAEGKDKELAEKLKSDKNSQVTKLDTQETLRKETVNKETTLVDVQTDNVVNEKDTPEQRLEKLKNVYEAEKAFKEAQFQEELAKLGSDQDAIRQLKAKHNQDVTEDERAYSESRKEIHRQESEQKVAEMKVVGQATDTLADIVGKQTVAGKALAVASALINTYAGATEVIKAKSILPEPFGTIQKVASVAAIIATGMKQVKAITAVQVPAKGGGGAGGAAPPQAPTINATALDPSMTQVKDVRVVQQPEQTVKAYIVDRDLQDHQDKTNFLNKLQQW